MSKISRRCDGVTRRDSLKLGVLSAIGLGLPDFLRARAAQGATTAREVSCILIWLDGGPSHLETFDPKPDAPIEIRGEFKPISTNVAGIRISEHLPATARVMDKVAVIRSLTHELGNHDTGSHYLLTGHRPTPVLAYPSLGSVVAKQAGFEAAMPPYIAIPEARPALQSGYLPTSFSPFAVGGDPSRREYRVRDLQPPDGVDLERLRRRREMVNKLDHFSRHVEATAATKSRDAFYEQAYRLITSPRAKGAFDLSDESPRVRDLYGRHRIGTSCLLARRLIDAGSRFVTVVDTGWDHHQDIFKRLPDSMFPGSGKLPSLDQAYASLLTDLEARGMLDTTLVVLMGEFGRTPKINSRAGRDHWPRAGFACLAGGGVRGGQVVGQTDAYGEAPIDRPVRPEDLAHTILTVLGIDPRTQYQTPDGQPKRILDDGTTIAELL